MNFLEVCLAKLMGKGVNVQAKLAQLCQNFKKQKLFSFSQNLNFNKMHQAVLILSLALAIMATPMPFKNIERDVEERDVVPLWAKTDKGIKFNVETVEIGPALQSKTDSSYIAKNFCEKEYGQIPGGTVEVTPLKNEETVIGRGAGGGLFDTIGLAFAKHYPLTIRPDDVWITLAYAFGQAVNMNSYKPEVRDLFVSHKGMFCSLIPRQNEFASDRLHFDSSISTPRVGDKGLSQVCRADREEHKERYCGKLDFSF
jgi:hypothetical protein